MFIRNPDGTGWEGHISYKWSSVRENNLRLNPKDKIVPPINIIYQLYGVCPALEVSEQLTNMYSLEPVYRFLYGYSIEELMEEKKENTGYYDNYVCEPKEWTQQMVMAMNWKMFCRSYYSFLCSNNGFNSNAWRVLEYIFTTLKKTPAILTSLLAINGIDSDLDSCSEFWETVYDGLQAKILNWLSEDTCYTAFCSMRSVECIFSKERYAQLENECCALFDELAKKRIDEAHNKEYSIRELLIFDIESIFFYKEYFEIIADNKNTRHYVTASAFKLLHTLADKVVASGNVISGDEIYEKTLKFAQSDSDRELIQNKRSEIAQSVEVAKKAQEEERREYEKKREIEQEEIRRKNKASDFGAKILIGIFLGSIFLTILFGILSLCGVFGVFSKTIFYVSLSIVVLFVIMIVITIVKEKY